MKHLQAWAQRMEADPDRMVIQACLACLVLMPILLSLG